MNKRPRQHTTTADPTPLPRTKARASTKRPSRAYLVSTSSLAQIHHEDHNTENAECSSLYAPSHSEGTARRTGTEDPYFCQGSTSNQADSVASSKWQPRPAASTQDPCKSLVPPNPDECCSVSYSDDETMTFVSDAHTVTYREPSTTESNPVVKAKESRGQLVGAGSDSRPFEAPVPPQDIFKVPAMVEKKTEKQVSKTQKKKDAVVWHSVDSRDFNQVHVQRENILTCKQTDFVFQSKITFQTQTWTSQPVHVDSRSLVAQTKDARSPNKGFVRFSSCVRHHYRSLNPNKSNKEVMIAIANAWRALDQSEKDYFRNPSFASDLRFFDMSSYVNKPSK